MLRNHFRGILFSTAKARAAAALVTQLLLLAFQGEFPFGTTKPGSYKAHAEHGTTNKPSI